MNFPTGVFGDATGRLWVAEQLNSRVLWFDNAAAKANGGNAGGVLGQPDFTNSSTNYGGRSAQSLNQPRLLFYDPAADVLWVADTDNRRVLRYSQQASLAIPPYHSQELTAGRVSYQQYLQQLPEIIEVSGFG